MNFNRIYSKLLAIPDISTVLNGPKCEIEIRIKPENKLKWAYFSEMVEAEIPCIGIIQTGDTVKYLFPENEKDIEEATKTFDNLLDRKYYLIEKPPADILTIICKITNLCNLDCQYCYDRPFREKIGHNVHLSLDELDKLLNMATHHAKKVEWIFHGGEPTLVGIEYYKEFFNNVVPKYPYANISFSLQTNGTLLNNDWFEFAKKVDLGISSSYSAKSEHHRETKEENQSVKNNENIYDVIPKIKAAQEIGCDIGIIDVVTKENMPLMIERYEFYKQRGLEVAFNNVEETGEAENHDFIFRTGKEKKYYLDAATSYFTYWLNDNSKNCYNDRYAAMYAEMLLTGSCATCNYGSECLTKWIGINSNGDLYPCDRPLSAKYRMGNIHDFSAIIEMFNTPQYKAFIDERQEKRDNYCRKCFVNSYCSGGCPLVDIDKHNTAALPNRYSCTMLKLNLTAMFRALIQTTIDSCNPIIKDFIVANSCVLPNEIPELLNRLGIKSHFSGLYYDHRTTKLNSKEFELFKLFNAPESHKRITPCNYDLSDCKTGALKKNSETRLTDIVELLRQRYEKVSKWIEEKGE